MYSDKLFIPYFEFYITNVCNLACTGCNRFNNYKFSGYQQWSDYKDIYAEWSRQVVPGSMAILGGEPLLNPTFMDWVRGVRSCWPDVFMRIVTNGFYLDRVKGLYDFLRDDPQTQLYIGVHNKQHKKQIIDKVTNFLTQPILTVHNNDKTYQEYIELTDSNDVRCRIEYNWWFHQGTLIDQDGQLSLHNSDVVKAHTNCHMKTCHHFVKGELYKCGVVAVLPDFAKQHHMDLDDHSRTMINAYKSLKITDTYEDKKKFIENLDQPIDQCRFCPETYQGQQIYAQEKKVLFHR